MAIDIKKIDFRAKLPEVPAKVSAVRVAAPALEERREAIRHLADRLSLGKTREIETPAGRLWAGKRGEVEFFEASGGLWSRDLGASEAHANELRDWPDLAEARDAAGETVRTLGPKAAKAAAGLAREVAERAGFDLAHAAPPRLELTQVAQLSEKGQTLKSGAGEASLLFDYTLDGLAVLGPGAKTAIDLEPGGKRDDGFRLVGAFHVWRRPLERRPVELGGAEAALAAGFLQDPELTAATRKGGRIVVEEIEFGLLALPAPARQEHLFPAFAVAGRVDLPDDRLKYFRFARYCHAATAKAYAAADLHADYLARPN
jgi:hypothetical protein